MKIAVYGTCQNEEANVAQWLKTTEGADYRIMCDTGSSDATAPMFDAAFADRSGDALYHISIEPFRSDDSRNAALALVPADADVCINLDLDETLQPGWREALEKSWYPGTTRGEYHYIWSHKEDGSPDVEFTTNNRVHSRHGYRWRHPAHEGISLNMSRSETVVQLPGFVIEQFQGVPKHRPRDKGLLEVLAWGQWEDPTSTRMMFYYARELMNSHYYKEAIEMFDRYLGLEFRNVTERGFAIGFRDYCQSLIEPKDAS